MLPLALLRQRRMLPAYEEPRPHLLVQAVVDGNLVFPGCGDELLEVGDGVCFGKGGGDVGVSLPDGCRKSL